MTIKVMPMRRPHSGSKPGPARHPDPRRGKPGGDARKFRRRVKWNAVVGNEARADSPDPPRDQGAIMVAGHEDHLPAGPERPPDQAQDRLGGTHRPLGAPFEQLHNVPEQYKPLDPLKRLEQPAQRLGLREDVVPQPGSQVKVREHERRHAGSR